MPHYTTISVQLASQSTLFECIDLMHIFDQAFNLTLLTLVHRRWLQIPTLPAKNLQLKSSDINTWIPQQVPSQVAEVDFNILYQLPPTLL